MSKHTEGPWTATLQPAGFIEIKSESGDVIADVCVKNVKANAQLLTAAPALLEALERITNEAVMDGLEDKAGWDCWIINARTAIEEARGGLDIDQDEPALFDQTSLGQSIADEVSDGAEI